MKQLIIYILFISGCTMIKKERDHPVMVLADIEKKVLENFKVIKFTQSDSKFATVRLTKRCFGDSLISYFQKINSQNFLIEIDKDSIATKNIYLEYYFSNNRNHLNNLYKAARMLLESPGQMRDCISVPDYWFEDILLFNDCVVFINVSGIDKAHLVNLLKELG